MSRSSPALQTLPGIATRPVTTLWGNLRIARQRRGESLRSMAQRMTVSMPTLRRMEAGDPSVAMGIYATAPWIFDHVENDHVEDIEALMLPGDEGYATRIEVGRTCRGRKRNGS